MSAGHLEIIPVKYGESVLAESMIFKSGILAKKKLALKPCFV